MLDWISTDGKLVFISMAVRTLAYTFTSIAISIYLDSLGFDPQLIGLIISIGFFSGAVFTLISSLFADYFGRRKLLIIFAIISFISGLILTLTRNFIAIALAVFLGSIGTTGAIGVFSPIEHAVIAQSCSHEFRTKAFSYYYLGSAVSASIGSLLASIPQFISNSYDIPLVEAFRFLFALFTFLMLVMLSFYVPLSSKCEVEGILESKFPRITDKTKVFIVKLSILFGVDSFAGGLIARGLFSYWLYIRFKIDLTTISQIFFVSQILVTISYYLAPIIAKKIGLVNTMVFTHLPASIMLAVLPLAPDIYTALAIHFARQLLCEMDVPTRQSYIMAIVEPKERVFASGITSLVRVFSASISPGLAGYLMKVISISAPLSVSGSLKAAYDLSLYFAFRNIKPPEEMEK